MSQIVQCMQCAVNICRCMLQHQQLLCSSLHALCNYVHLLPANGILKCSLAWLKGLRDVTGAESPSELQGT